MSTPMEHICALIDQHTQDALLPRDVVKTCIAVLGEAKSQNYAAHIELLRGQIGIWGSDDTTMFSMQLVAGKLKSKLLEIDAT